MADQGCRYIRQFGLFMARKLGINFPTMKQNEWSDQCRTRLWCDKRWVEVDVL